MYPMPRVRTSSGAENANQGPVDCVGVLLPLPLAGTYDYSVPEGLSVSAGDFVRVPLGSRDVIGVVWGGAAGAVAREKIRPVIRCLDAPSMADPMRRFIEWVAAYTVRAPGAILRMAMSVPEALEPPRPITAYGPADPLPDVRMTSARKRVLDVLADGPPRPATELAREAGVSVSVVSGLSNAGALETVALPAPTDALPDWRRPGPALSAAQADVAKALRDAIGGGFAVDVVDGVPGSGKTEVYFEAIAEALAQDRQVLVLLPEIALGAQWFSRFQDRFGAAPAEWHSDLAQTRRRRTWRAVADGTARVVVGARSALFLPFPELGLIVVDEEHDASFKQEDGIAYNARDMAIVRARISDIPTALVSATPSLETLVNVERRRFRRLHLPDRHAGMPPPNIEVVDMRADPAERGRWLSPPLGRALAETVTAGRQAMLFLNRRGYAPLTLCRACGHRMRCPQCTAWLVEHRLMARLQCHHCGFHASLPPTCPECGADDNLIACGPGVERLAEEVSDTYPGIRFVIAASDTLTGPAATAELVRRIEDHEVDLVIGTQVVAKGYHFPLLSLVGVVDADLGLGGGDLRAAERTYQLLYQVAGRSGREGSPGRVLLQTYMPENAVISAMTSGDRDRFIATEAAARRDAGMPPFGRLASLVVSGRDARAVEAAAQTLGRAAPTGDDVRVLGPAPAPMAVLRGRHRHRLLMIAPRSANVPALVRRWLGAADLPNTVRVHIDIDPYSFL